MKAYREQEGGAVAVVTAITLLVLMGIAALAIDAGRGYVERSSAQNAADHAALAAAWAWCNTTGADSVKESAARTAGLASAQRNGYTVGVAIDPLAADKSKWTATVPGTVSSPFANAIGLGASLSVRARAQGGCTPGVQTGNPYSIFASGPCPSGVKTVDMGGSDVVITGDVHSNGVLHLSGSNMFIDGRGTWVTAYEPAGSNITWTRGVTGPVSPVSGAVLPYAFSDYQPGNRYDNDGDVVYNAFTGNRKVSELPTSYFYDGSTRRSLKEGIYYTSGEWEIDRNDLTGTVTFVAPSEIQFKGDRMNLAAYKGPLAYGNRSSSSCGDKAISIQQSRMVLNGVFYAPNGLFEISGNENKITGGVVARRVMTGGGQGNHIELGPLSEGAPPEVGLLR